MLLSLVTVVSAADPILSVSEQVKSVLPSIVKIKAQKSVSDGDESELISADTGGTGFVIDNTHILTNAHVIGDAKKIAIMTQDNTEYPALLVGKDTKTDIAVLEITDLTLSPLKSHDPGSLKIGDSVFVIGFPFSLGLSVSQGIAGGLNRFLPNYPYIHFIQTDAAVNPGNSGGPMFNRDGQLVGVVSTYFSRQGGYTNIAFAIPIEEAQRIADRLIRDKTIRRGYFGAELLISEKVTRKLGEQNGIFITYVNPDSPAAKSGVKAGDLIVGIDGSRLHDSGELHRLLERSSPDDEWSALLLRNGQNVTAKIRLGDQTDDKVVANNAGENDAAAKLGLLVEENGQQINVLVSYGAARTAGLRQSDTIFSINGKQLKSIRDLNERLSNLKENEFAFVTVQRQGERFILPLGAKTAIKGYSTRN